MQDATLIDALNQATSLELYQLSALVERLITDPRRIAAVRKDLHLGQVIRFSDGRRDSMRDAQVTLHDTQQRVQCKLRRDRATAARCTTAAANIASLPTACYLPETHAR